MNTTLEKLKERIKDKKYKLTTQRQTILQAFIDADENHSVLAQKIQDGWSYTLGATA